MNDDDLETLREWSRGAVRGFGDVDEGCVDDGVDYMKGTYDVPRGLVEQLLAEEIDEQRALEATFPPVTDNDRIDAAFAALDKKGIYAQQNFWCCQTCGHSAARDEVAQSNGRYRGYVFYHEQDTEAAIHGAGLYLAFGAADDARAAVDELNARGITTRWNGSEQQRPFVEVKWQRRRLT